jgi:hypothetical protein
MPKGPGRQEAPVDVIGNAVPALLTDLTFRSARSFAAD